MKRIALIFLLVSCLGSFAATNFVDIHRTGSGNNDGTSWENAWTNITSIAWGTGAGEVGAGDTLWISDGTYAEHMEIGAGGTYGNPIIIKTSREAGHNTNVIITARDVDDNAIGIPSGYRYITIDGAKDDSYAANCMTNTWMVTNMVTNINLILMSADGNPGIRQEGGGIVGLVLQWIKIQGKGYGSFHANEDGFFLGSGNEDYASFSNNIIAYCIVNGMGQDGIKVYEASGVQRYDQLIVHHCWFKGIGDDGIEGQNGITLHHSFFDFDGTDPAFGHADGYTGGLGWVRIYNNVIIDFRNCQIYPMGFPWEMDYQYGFQCYGNLVYYDYAAQVEGDTSAIGSINIGVEDDNDAPVHAATPTNMIEDYFIVANNTVIGDQLTTPGITQNPITISGKWQVPGPANLYAHVITASNFIVVNNLVWNAGSDFSMKGNWEYSGWQVYTNEFILDYNQSWSALAAGRIVEYMAENEGDHFDDFSLVDDAFPWLSNNRTNEPLFINTTNHDFRVFPTSPNINVGTNLTSLDLPGWTNDLWGHPRGSFGGYDIGAYEFPGYNTNGLLCWLRFEDSFTDWVLSDSSTNGANMLRYGWYEDEPAATNWPSAITGRRDSYAADFSPYYWNTSLSGWPNHPTFFDGEYGAITNLGRMLNMTQATIMCWGYYNSAYDDNIGEDHNGAFLSAGQTDKGAWHLGRRESWYPRFFIHTNNNEGIDDKYGIDWSSFTNDSEGSPGYQWSNWVHYAVTVDCTDSSNVVIKGYHQGTCFVTNTMKCTNEPVPFLTASDPGWADYGAWIAVGCWTHAGLGTPPLDDGDEFPNNGWLSGKIDDVRIYNRVLTDGEVYSIFDGSESGGGAFLGGEEEEEEVVSTNTVRKVGMRGRSTTIGNVRFR